MNSPTHTQLCPLQFMKPISKLVLCAGGGGAVAQSVERATPGQEVPGSLPTGWVGVSIM